MSGQWRNRDRTWRSDDGISLPFVALAMVALCGSLALSVDIGHGYQVRRSLIPATDAAALAAAQDLSAGLNGCTTQAGGYVALNEGGATMDDCHTGGNTDQGWVSVTASHPVETWFAGVIGSGDYTASSTSLALWGPPSGVIGLRPIGICLASNPDIQNIVTTGLVGSQIVTVPYHSGNDDACGPMPGNWGTIDFNGGSSSNAETTAWVESGYSGVVSFGNDSPASCGGEPHCVAGDTGALSGLGMALADLRDSGEFFAVPVFDLAELVAPGQRRYHIAGIIRVQLVDFNVTGAEINRFFTFNVEAGLVTGPCCGPPAPSGIKVVWLCGVDPGDTSACNP